MMNLVKFFSLSVLLFIVLGFVVFYFNPLNLRDRIFASVINYSLQMDKLEKTGKIMLENEKEESTKKEVVAPLLSDEQIKKLESYGINTSLLPKDISLEMADCFSEKLGEERVTEIISGSEPTPVEIFKTKDCLNK